MRLSGTKTGSANQYNGLGDQLYDLGGARPTLDLNFASNGSLVDSVTGKTLVTHTRASNATYVDGDGIIKDAVTNINLHSTMNTSYVSTNTDGVYETDQITAPDGTLTGNKFTEASTTAGRYVRNNYTQNTFTSGKFYLLSVYLKEGDNTNKRYAGLIFPGLVFSTNKAVTFNLTGNGTATPNSGSGEEPAVYGIESVGNGWYRCWIGATATVTSTMREQYRITDTSNNAGASYAGDGSSHIFMWGTQLEELNSQQSTPGEYVKTTSTINSAPRFDHNPTTGESLGLLVEESRTNIVTYSEASKAHWGTAGTPTEVDLTDNGFGRFNGVSVTDGGQNWHGINTPNFSATSGTTYAVTTFAKYGTANKIRVVFRNNSSITESYIEGNPGNLAVVSELAGTISNLTEELRSDNTVKISFVVTANSTSSNNHYIRVAPATTNNSDVIVYAVQVEAGSFPTSYIRTEGSTVTRSADVTSIEGNDFGTFNLLQYSEEFDQSVWAKVAVSVTANQRTAPDGTLSMDTVTVTGGAGFLQQAITVVNSTVYTASTYVYADSDKTRIIIHNGTSDICNVSWTSISANTTTVSGTASNITSTDVGNGIYRLTFTFTSTSTTANYRIQPLDSSGNAVVGATGYFWGAQLEESSTATPYVKSDVTWTSRASNATYYDYTGTLRKSSYNLLTYSEQFDNVVWSTASLTITADDATAPDGTQTADKWLNTSTTGIISNSISKAASAITYTASLWVKSSDATSFSLTIDSGGTGDRGRCIFNITTGELVSTINDGTFTGTSGTITAYPDSWYRLTVTTTTNTGSIARWRAFSSGNGDIIYIWGAQLETGPYAGDYAKTEGSAASSARNVAFLPDGSGNFVSAGELLLEDAGTNLLLNAESIDLSPWTGANRAVTANAISSLDGTITADKLTETAVSGEHYLRQFVTGLSTNTVYSVSCFVKPAERSRFRIRILDTDNVSNGYLCDFNLSSQTASTQSVGAGLVSGNATITNVGNGWYRCSVSGNASTGTKYTTDFFLVSNSGDISYTGTSNEGFYLWGAQLEQSPYPTSYIPTYGSTATRAADVSSSSSNTFGNSFYNQTEGTVFAEIVGMPITSGQFPRIYEISDGTISNIIRSQQYGSNTVRNNISSGGTSYMALDGGVIAEESSGKTAFAVAENNCAIVTNGGTPAVDDTVTMPNNLDQILILRSTGGTSAANSTISRLTYWPTRLSNDTLQTITV